MPQYKITVNRDPVTVDASPEETLLQVLREHLDLTGTKYGCGEGQCGSCTVLIGDRAVKSCLVAIGDVSLPVTTIEGLAADGLHPVQRAFLDHGAFQCGFCTAGMIMGAVSLLKRAPQASEQDIRSGLQSHICRCGTHPRILAAVLSVAEKSASQEVQNA